MTNAATHPVDSETCKLVDDLAVISGVGRRADESPTDYLVRLVWSQRDTNDLLACDVRTATDLLDELARNEARLPIFQALAQSWCAVLPLIPLIVWFSGFITVYAVWLVAVCFLPVLTRIAFGLYLRLRGEPSEPEERPGA